MAWEDDGLGAVQSWEVYVVRVREAGLFVNVPLVREDMRGGSAWPNVSAPLEEGLEVELGEDFGAEEDE